MTRSVRGDATPRSSRTSLRLLMERMNPAPRAVLVALHALLNLLLVALGVVVHAMTHAALEFDEVILGHTVKVTGNS